MLLGKAVTTSGLSSCMNEVTHAPFENVDARMHTSASFKHTVYACVG